VRGEVRLPLLLLAQGMALRVLAQGEPGGVGDLVEQPAHLLVERIGLGGHHHEHPGRRARGRVHAIDGPGKQRPAADRTGVLAQLGAPGVVARRAGPGFAPDHRRTLHEGLGRRDGARAVLLPWRHRQGQHHLGDRPDQGHAAQGVLAFHGGEHVDRRGAGDIRQRTRQGGIDRFRIGLFQQRALDRALRIAVAAHADAAFEQHLVVPEPAQLVDQALRPVQQFLAQRRAALARVRGQHQLAAVAGTRGGHDAGAEAVLPGGVAPVRKLGGGHRGDAGALLAQHDADRAAATGLVHRVAQAQGLGIGLRRSRSGQHLDRMQDAADFEQRSPAIVTGGGMQQAQGFRHASIEALTQFAGHGSSVRHGLPRRLPVVVDRVGALACRTSRESPAKRQS